MFSWLERLFEKDWTNVSVRLAYDKELDKWKRASDQHSIPVRYERDIVDDLKIIWCLFLRDIYLE